MRKNIVKRTLAAVLAVILTGNLWQLPGSSIQAASREINIENEEDYTSDNSTASDDAIEEKQLKEERSEEKQSEEKQSEEQLKEEPPEEVSEERTKAQETSSIFEVMQIGQTDDVEALPYLEDSNYIYDMPVLLAGSGKIRLFVNQSITAAMDKDDTVMLTWSILRGKEGMTRGTANLVNQEDDWMDFETVSSSPNFTMQEDEDKNSSFYKTVFITANAPDIDDHYDYYIRATFQCIKEQTEYTAMTTLPIVVKKPAARAVEEAVTEEAVAEEITAEETVTEETAVGAAEEVATEENAAEEIQAGPVTEPAEESVEESADVETDESLKTSEETENSDGLMSLKAEGSETDAEKNHDRPTDENGNTIEISDEVWIAGFEKESDALTYTGNKITQDIRIYHKDTLLKENTDYMLTYKNNTNAAPHNSFNAPSVTITMQGQYAGERTLYFTIAPRDIGEEPLTDYEQVLTYSKKMKIPAPTLYYGSKKLVPDKDFICDYSSLPENYTQGDSYEEDEVYEYTVVGTGNFTGSFRMKLAVIKNKYLDFDNAVVTFGQKQYEYHGEALSEADVQITSVKLNKTILDESLYEYRVCAEGVGDGYVEIYPSAAGRNYGYRGMKKLKIKVVADRNIKNSRLGDDWQSTILFSQKEMNQNGGICQKKTGVLIFGEGSSSEPLTEGLDYTVKYSNHKKAGTATVTFTGTGRYTGSFKKTYKIAPNTELYIKWYSVDEDGLPTASYMKGGAMPGFELLELPESEDACALNSKTDYSVKVKNNKKPGIMTCEITGTGNYKGYKSVTEVKVISGDISQGTMEVSDKQYSSKANAWKSSVTIKDANEKKLTAGTDYDKILTYNYEGMEGGEPPQAGTTVYVTAMGINNYSGSSITGSYRIYSTSISKLIILIDTQEYTGGEIELSTEDIHVYASKNDVGKGIEITDACYKIVAYSNNIKAGTAKVTLRGIGDYGGTRVCSFKIDKKKYLTARVTEVVLDETSILMGEGSSRQLTATVIPEDAWNKTLLWTTSDSKIVSVSQEGIITANRTGKAKITVTSQDTGKKASCAVTVAVIPVTSFSLNTEEIHQNEGTWYQLTATDIWPEDALYSTISWESTNPEIASVDDNGRVSLRKAGMAVIKAYGDERRFVRKCLVFVDGREETKPEGSYLTPQMFRTYDEEDDTKAFNEAIKNLSKDCDTLYIPAGTYKIDAQTSINLRSNMNLIMSPNAVLKAMGNFSRFYDVIHGNNVRNVTISGGQIKGERYEHGGTAGEWGMGIGLYDCTDIHITDVASSRCWGDGIYIGSHHEEDRNAGCCRITITNCNFYNNRRNNLSIVCGDYITVDNCAFSNANGTAPEFGIDIETNNSSNPCEHITISNSVFEGNNQGSIGIITVADDVRISDCKLNGSFVNYAGTNVVISNSVIRGEVNARIGISLTDGARINDGGDAEDTLVASFSANQGPDLFDTYRIDDSNRMSCSIVEDSDSPSGKALCLKRLSKGTQEAGYSIKLSKLAEQAALEKGAVYRFEYVVKGSGQWGIKTNQTGWYPCVPMSDKFSMGTVTYQAGGATSCILMLYAVDMTKDMYLEIDDVKIYKVN